MHLEIKIRLKIKNSGSPIPIQNFKGWGSKSDILFKKEKKKKLQKKEEEKKREQKEEEGKKTPLEVKIKVICHVILILYNSSFRSIVPGPQRPGHLLEIPIFRLYPRPTE